MFLRFNKTMIYIYIYISTMQTVYFNETIYGHQSPTS